MVPFIIILLAFLADRLSKWWMADFLAEHGRTYVNRWLTFTEVHNQGVAFGMFQGIGPLVGWLTMGVVVALFVYLLSVPRWQWLLRWGLAFIIGGALGNMVDRIFVGQVLDFIETPLRSGVFNVADVMIHTGLVLAIAGTLLQRRTAQEAESA